MSSCSLRVSSLKHCWLASRAGIRSATVVSTLALAVLLLSHGMLQKLDHDEHQFIASGALLLRHGLVPYRDYPYFHTPYLAVVYAALFALNDHLLLMARLFSTACAAVSVVLVSRIAGRRLADQPGGRRLLMAFAAAVILLGNPTFLATSGRSWNHDLPTLLTLLAFMLAVQGEAAHRNAARACDALWTFAAAGFLMGLATGVRLTFAPAAAIFALALIRSRKSGTTWRHRAARAGTYILGLSIALLPCALLMAQAPRAFIFGNLEYAMLNTSYRSALRYQTAMNAPGKLVYVLTRVLSQPATLGVVALCLVALIAARRRLAASHDPHMAFSVRLLVLLDVALLVGSFAPTPSFIEYFYTPMVFVLITALYAAPLAFGSSKQMRSAFIAVAVLALPTLVMGYWDLGDLFSWRQWVPLQAHSVGVRVAALAHRRRVLTLAPIFPLEGHAEIYPQLATGPFAWRVGPFVAESRDGSLRILDADCLDSDLRRRRPALVLLYHEFDLEVPLRAYAQRRDIRLAELARFGPSESPLLSIERQDHSRCHPCHPCTRR